MGESPDTSISTFIAYTLTGIRPSRTWTVPSYEQVLCSCAGGTRTIAVQGMSKTDNLFAMKMTLQKGPTGILLVLDGGHSFCSYMMKTGENASTVNYRCHTITSDPGSLNVIPFSSCVVIDMESCVRNNSAGIFTIAWLKRAVHITITVYGNHETVHHSHLDLQEHNMHETETYNYRSPQTTATDCVTFTLPSSKSPDNMYRHKPTGVMNPTSSDDKTDDIPEKDTAEKLTRNTIGESTIDLLAEVIREADLETVVQSYDTDVNDSPLLDTVYDSNKTRTYTKHSSPDRESHEKIDSNSCIIGNEDQTSDNQDGDLTIE